MPDLQRPQLPGTFDFGVRTPGTSAFWIEQVDDISPASEEFSPRYAHATLYAYVPNGRDSMYNFVNAVCGYHYTDSSFQHITRVNPVRHPKYENLYATKVSEVKGVRFGRSGAGRAVGTFNEKIELELTGAELILQEIGQTVTPTVVEVAADKANKGLTQYAIYDRNLVSVEFAPPKWKMRADARIKGKDPESSANIYQEWKRYVDYDTRTSLYDVSIQSGQFVYQEGADNAPKGLKFQGEINFFEVKTSFTLRWRCVPDDWVFNTFDYEMGYPVKLNAAAAKVNKYDFMGYPAGTLLLLEPDTERYVSGTLRRNDSSGDNLPFYMCDVSLPIIHFDPKRGGTARGHNLKPWRKTGDTELTYYLVKYTNSAGLATDLLVYGEYDFNKIFQHWSVA